MLQTLLPVLSECVIAFDVSLKHYITIGPFIGMLSGYDEGEVPTEPNFWYSIIHPDDFDKVKLADQQLLNSSLGDTGYRINPVGSNTVRHITERRRSYTDTVTGHQILISILNEHDPFEAAAKADVLKREQFLLSLINSQTNFLIRLNKHGEYTFVNKAYCRAMEYTEAELIGEHFALNTLREDLAGCRAAFSKCLNNPGLIIPLIKDKVSKTGNQYPSEWEFVSVINEAGEVTEIQGIGRDISQRVAAENLIISTNQKLDNFIESITDAFCILDKEWRFIRTNTALETMTGKTRDELIGKPAFEVYRSIKGTIFEDELKEAEKTQRSRQFTMLLPVSKRWIRATIYPSVEGLTVFAKNITEQKKAEEELNWTRSNLESLINNTKDHIWSIDTSLHYMYTNSAYKEAVMAETGLLPAEGRPVVIFGNSETRSLWQAYYKKALAGERFDVVYEHLNSVTGDTQYYEVGFNPIYNSLNEVVGMGCFARDVTQHLNHEKEIISQNERLRHIASISSHELRRPVASMLGLINIIDFDNFSNPENKETIGYLLTVGKEIDEVIKLIVDNAFTGNAI